MVNCVMAFLSINLFTFDSLLQIRNKLLINRGDRGDRLSKILFEFHILSHEIVDISLFEGRLLDSFLELACSSRELFLCDAQVCSTMIMSAI